MLYMVDMLVQYEVPTSALLSCHNYFSCFFLAVARQMKTINYQLSSQRCLEQGWTLRAPSPMVADDAESEMFVLEPLHPAMIAAGKVCLSLLKIV